MRIAPFFTKLTFPRGKTSILTKIANATPRVKVSLDGVSSFFRVSSSRFTPLAENRGVGLPIYLYARKITISRSWCEREARIRKPEFRSSGNTYIHFKRKTLFRATAIFRSCRYRRQGLPYVPTTWPSLRLVLRKVVAVSAKKDLARGKWSRRSSSDMSKQAAGVCASYEASGLASLGNRAAYRDGDYDAKGRGRARNGGVG